MKTRENSFTLFTLLLLAMAILALTSCRKDDEPEPEDQPLGMLKTPGQFERTITINYTLLC